MGNFSNPNELPSNTEQKYCIIGGGPAGMSGAKALKDQGVDFSIMLNDEWSTSKPTAKKIDNGLLNTDEIFLVFSNLTDISSRKERIEKMTQWLEDRGRETIIGDYLTPPVCMYLLYIDACIH